MGLTFFFLGQVAKTPTGKVGRLKLWVHTSQSSDYNAAHESQVEAPELVCAGLEGPIKLYDGTTESEPLRQRVGRRPRGTQLRRRHRPLVAGEPLMWKLITGFGLQSMPSTACGCPT